MTSNTRVILRPSAILILSLALGTGIKAQTYRPMPESNATWVELHGWLQPYALSPDCGWYTQFNCERAVHIGADTLLSGVTYHKLYREGQCHYEMVGSTMPEPGCPYSGIYSEPLALVGMFRQDTSSKTVYWYDTYEHQELLLYDFTMGIGTYPQTENNWDYPSITVTAIDSVLLGDGFHKRFMIDVADVFVPQFVIEGVGTSFGLFNPMVQGIESGTALTCFARDGTLVYADTVQPWISCDLYLGMSEPDATSAVEVIYPNPGTDQFSLSLSPGPHIIALFDALGRMVHQQRISDERATINTARLPSGTYLVKVDESLKPLRWVKE